MSERAARLALAGVVLALVTLALRLDLRSLSGARFWGDGATYYSMAWSLAEDLDLRYEVRDLERTRRDFGSGPEGIFLKRASGGFKFVSGFPWLARVAESEPQVYFAKPFAYPLVAAPLVRAFGTRGLLLTNALALGLCLLLGYSELRRRASPAASLTVSCVLFLATVAPIYLLWPTPELFNMALVTAGLVAWSGGRPAAAALLLGVAIYSKPYNLWLAIPLGLAPLMADDLRRGLLEASRRAAVCALTVIALFGVNAAITGEANYQGGRERKTFYGKFPGDIDVVNGEARVVTFGNSGTWMSTNDAGPSYEGRETTKTRGAEPPRSKQELVSSFLRNLGYFWVGRFGGALPYYFPFGVGLVFFAFGPRSRDGWLALVALAVSYLFFLVMIPDNWYGGSGTVGNRYFLNLLPLGLFLLPRGREAPVALVGVLGSALFLGPVWAAPMAHSLHHGTQTTLPLFRALPAELTMLNDLSVFEEPWRKKQPFGDTEGDARSGRRADPRAYYLYFPDDGTFGREGTGEAAGFWLRGGARAQVFLRALEPVRSIRFELSGGPAGDDVTIRVARAQAAAHVAAAGSADATLLPGAGFSYKDSFVYVLDLASSRGASGADPRSLGAFVRIAIETDPRPLSR